MASSKKSSPVLSSEKITETIRSMRKASATKNGKRMIITIVVLAFAGVFVWWYVSRDTGPSYETDTVTRGELREEVDVTGTVAPAEDVVLSFEQGGKVSYVPVSVGSYVYAGQPIAYLSNDDMEAQLKGAEARRDAALADLAKLEEGTRPEELDVYEAQVTQAKRSVSQAEDSVYTVISDAFTRADGAVRGNTDQLFSNPRSSRPTLSVFVSDPSLKNDIEWRRFLLEEMLTAWETSLSVRADVSGDTEETNTRLLDVQTFLQKVALAVNALEPTSVLSQTTIDGYKSAVASGRSSVSVAISGVSNAETSFVSAEQSLRVAESQYALRAAPATNATKSAAQAQVTAAEAQVAQYRALLAKTILTAPVGGTVTSLDVTAGETVNAGKEVARLISVGKYEIETYVPEADITKVRVGDTATFTLDAYDDSVVFHATVVMIDPAETVIEGVATYKVTLRFTDEENRVRSGMTANVTILCDIRSDVLSVPIRSVETNDDGSLVVRVLGLDGIPVSRTITTGLRGSDGRIEVSGDIVEGEEVVLFEKK
jgi:RND family efflux transporter MFP subunit